MTYLRLEFRELISLGRHSQQIGAQFGDGFL